MQKDKQIIIGDLIKKISKINPDECGNLLQTLDRIIGEVNELEYKESSQFVNSLIVTRRQYDEIVKATPSSGIITALPFMDILSIQDKMTCLKELGRNNMCKEEDIPEKTYVFKPTERYNKVFFITEGLIKLSSTAPTNGEDRGARAFALMSAGDMLGELEIFNSYNRKTVCAAKAVLADAKGISMDRHVFTDLLKRVPGIYKWLHMHMSAKIIGQGIEWNSQDEYVRVLLTLSVLCNNPAFKAGNKIVVKGNKTELGGIIGADRHKPEVLLSKMQNDLNAIKKNTVIVKYTTDNNNKKEAQLIEITINDPEELINKCKKIDKNNIFPRLASYR